MLKMPEKIPEGLPEKYHKRWQWLCESPSAAMALDVELSKAICRDLATALKQTEWQEKDIVVLKTNVAGLKARVKELETQISNGIQQRRSESALYRNKRWRGR